MTFLEQLTRLVKQEAPGWTVTLTRDDGERTELHLTHPLSDDGVRLSYLPLPDQGELLRQIRASIRRLGIFRALAGAGEVTHVSFLRELREVADALQLPGEVRSPLAKVFRRHSVLTEAEAAWFGEMSAEALVPLMDYSWSNGERPSTSARE